MAKVMPTARAVGILKGITHCGWWEVEGSIRRNWDRLDSEGG